MTIFSKEFVLGAAERALKTAAQTLIAAMGVNQVGIMDFDWAGALSVTAFAVIMSVLTSIVNPSFTAGAQAPAVAAASGSDAEKIAPEDVTAAIADAGAVTLTGVAGSDALVSDAALTPEAAAAAAADAVVTATYQPKHVADAPADVPTDTVTVPVSSDGNTATIDTVSANGTPATVTVSGATAIGATA